MQYTEIAPSPALGHLIRCYWVLRSDGDGDSDAVAAPTPEPALPDGSPELIFNFADPFEALDQLGARTPQPRAMLVGQISRPFTVVATGALDLVAVRFEPCGAALLCDNLSAITDTWMDVRDLPDDGPRATMRALFAALSDVADDAARVALLDAALTTLVAVRRGPDDEVAAAVRAIVETHGAISLESLASTLGCSLRHLQRRFAVQVGISPKLLARIRRFQRVFSAWRNDPRSLSRVATECSYFDQPHLIRDFRDFAGSAPAAFLANQPEFTQLFLPTNPSR